MAATATFKKGMIVKTAAATELFRATTEAEKAAWRDSEASKGMTSGGDTKLHSGTEYRRAKADETFKIVRARVTAARGWHKVAKCAEVVDTDGTCWFVRRANLN